MTPNMPKEEMIIGAPSNPLELREEMARALMFLVKDHKERCDGHCEYFMFLMKALYEDLAGRELTKEETSTFI
jgi:hypothetical protein